MRSSFATKAPRRIWGRQRINDWVSQLLRNQETGASRSCFALRRRRVPRLAAIPSLREQRLSYKIRKLLAPMHPGRMAEWLNAPVLKTGEANNFRGFESHSFRQAPLCRRQFAAMIHRVIRRVISSNSKKPFLRLQKGLFLFRARVKKWRSKFCSSVIR